MISDMDAGSRATCYASYDVPILEWYRGCFDAVYVAFHPFFRIDADTPSDATQLAALTKRIARPIAWEAIREGLHLPSLAVLDRALRTSIGGLTEAFADKVEAQRLATYCDAALIWPPREGELSPLLERPVGKLFQKAGFADVVLQDELFGNIQSAPTEAFLDDALVRQAASVDFRVASIYAPDKSLLVTTDWDSFFTLICGAQNVLRKADVEGLFEGFWCDEATRHDWCLARDQ
jgi:hypothetical protein